MIAVRGLAHFWASDLIQANYVVPGEQPRPVIGEVVQREQVTRERLQGAGLPVAEEGSEFMVRQLLKVGNREFGADFVWVVEEWMQDVTRPRELLAIERREWGNFYGYLLAVRERGQLVAEGEAAWSALQERLARAGKLFDELNRLERVDIGAINYGMERLRLKARGLQLDDKLTAEAQADIDAQRAEYQAQYRALEDRLAELNQALSRDSILMRTAAGQEVEINLAKVVDVYRPNAMSTTEKLGFYGAKLWEFVSDDPREANTEGGVFPAIFGTVLMVMIMAVIVTPFGVIAAVYLREYAKQGPLTRLIRIAVNNLAGVPRSSTACSAWVSSSTCWAARSTSCSTARRRRRRCSAPRA